MHFYESGSLMEGLPTTIGTPGTVHRMDLSGRVQGFMETIPRDTIDPTSGAPSPSAGTLALTYFTADQTMTVSNLTSATRGTAQAGATLARMALFEIDPVTGDGKVIATTTSDRTMWQSVSTAYTKAISDDGRGGGVSSVKLIQGRRYAFAVLHVGSSTAPILAGKSGIPGLLAGSGPTTRKGGYVSGQSDIPTSFLGTTIIANNGSGNYYYAGSPELHPRAMPRRAAWIGSWVRQTLKLCNTVAVCSAAPRTHIRLGSCHRLGPANHRSDVGPAAAHL
jgi:hypothetical protein